MLHLKPSLATALLLAALLLSSATATVAQPATVSVNELIDALGLATQPGKEDDWSAQRAAEADTARQIRARIAASPGAAELTEADRYGRTPLINAALRGYAEVVEALLTDPGVKLAINAKDNQGLSAWMAAQYARPLTLASCHPQVLIREAVGLWGPNLRRLGYFSQQSRMPFDRIRAALGATGAQPDLAEAIRQWRLLCPGHDPALDPALDASEDLLATLLADSNPRLQAFLSDMKFVPKTRPTNALPPQPVLPALKGRVQKTAQPAQAARSKPRCSSLPVPDAASIGPVSWTGSALFRFTVEVQDGVPVAAEVTLLKEDPSLPLSYALPLRAATYRALGGYRCPGDFMFDQEFQYKFK